jgi:glycosyltransferase involved in cell wall biosynthesis
MRVVYLADAPYIHTKRWVEHFAAVGWEAHVISFRPATIPGATVHYVDGLERIGKARYLAHARRVRCLVHDLEPDLLHAMHLTSYGFLAGMCSSHPKLTSVWGRDVMAVAASTPWHTFLTRYALSKADHVTATGPRLAEATLRYTPPGKPVTVVPYGIDLDRFRPRDPRPATRDTLTIGAVARLSPEKGLDVLIDAAAKLIAQGRDLRVLLVGDGPERSRLVHRAARLGIADRVEFRGDVPHDRVPDVLSEMDIFAMPSREEGFGVAALEASAMQLPVVASDTHGIPDAVEHEGTGILVAPNDVVALANAIACLTGDLTLRERLGRQGRAFVEERYRWQDNAAQMERLYHHLIASFTGGAARATVPGTDIP